MVYVDGIRTRYQFGRMKMCHMIADTPEELHAMADQIGVNRKWLQSSESYREHYDICSSKRALAIAAGAKEITIGELGTILCLRREHARKLSI